MVLFARLRNGCESAILPDLVVSFVRRHSIKYVIGAVKHCRHIYQSEGLSVLALHFGRVR